MSENRERAVLALKLIAAVAGKAASDLENGRLWPGQLSDQIALISRNLHDAADGDKK